MNEYHILEYLVTLWKTEVEAEVQILISETAFPPLVLPARKIWLYFQLSQTDFAFSILRSCLWSQEQGKM